VTSLTISFGGNAVPHGLEGVWFLTAGLDNLLKIFSLTDGSEVASIPLRGWAKEIATARDPDVNAFTVGTTRNVVAVTLPDCSINVLSGTGDLQALAEGSGRYPFRVMSRGGRTVIESAVCREILAAYPLPLENIVMHPTGRIWCGSYGREVHILRLEGME
jgi:hypothetical protein